MQLRNTNPDGKGESNLAKNLRSEINRTVPELDMMMLLISAREVCGRTAGRLGLGEPARECERGKKE